MPLTLVRRAGGDTLGKLEAAARMRFREAEKLYAAGEPLSAIYLYGYSVEIRLKVAYYRMKGLVRRSSITDRLRRDAEREVTRLLKATSPPPPVGPTGHHVMGWTFLVQATRGATGRTPLAVEFVRKLHEHVDTISTCWSVDLRYRANRPYNDEVQGVCAAARWFRVNAGRLWR